jgi:phenylalanyl-tRNA synthetase beta subunit
MCVIADDHAVLGFGGILGGESTGCTHETRNVLIECAYFDPLRTAATGRRPASRATRAIASSAASISFHQPGLDLATAMMLEVAGASHRRPGSPGRHLARRPSSASTSADREARRHRLPEKRSAGRWRHSGLRSKARQPRQA